MTTAVEVLEARPTAGALSGGRAPVRPRADRGPRAGPRPPDRPDRVRLRRELLPADPEGRRPGADRRRGRRALPPRPRDEDPDDAPRGGNVALGAGRHGRPPRRGRPPLADREGRGRREEVPGAAGRHRRLREQRAQALPREDGAGPGLHQHLHDGRHPLEQLERHVLRRHPERLPHARVAHVPPPLGDADRHRRARRRRALPRGRAGALAGDPRPEGEARGRPRARRRASGRSTG